VTLTTKFLDKGSFEGENKILTREQVYQQLSHRASLIKAILQYVSLGNKSEK
jgi:hypothetical protein